MTRLVIDEELIKKARENERKRDAFKDLPEKTVKLPDNKGIKPITDYLDGYYKTLGDGTTKYLGIETGIKELDNATLGLDGLIILGGIAGQGKTSLALQVSYMACELDTPVLFYSLEMPRRAIITKIFSRLSKVPYGTILLNGRSLLDGTYEEEPADLDNGFNFSDKQTNKITEAKESIEALGDSFYIRTREAGEKEIDFKTVEEEINKVKAKHSSNKVLVVIDHLQVFQAGEYKDQLDKENKLITNFKGISDRTGATIILISQKNKPGFKGRGSLEEIKGSVDIVYLADLVMLLQEKNEGEEQIYSNPELSRDIDLLIVKNRYNAPTKIAFDFDGASGSFTVNKTRQ
jgi:replicative DNA helicase